MLRIGVVCEGQTDFVAMKAFLEAEFKGAGKGIELILIQPALDNSLPAGWSQVLFWLENNELSFRSALYLRGNSLFETEDAERKYDALLFQIDSDIIGEGGFESFILKRRISYSPPSSVIDRGDIIRHILLSMAGHASDAAAVTEREVMAPIVESSEAWIIAADSPNLNAEALAGQQLIDEFGRLVARLNGSAPKASYSRINKKVKTRERICSRIAQTSTPRGRAHHYDEVVNRLSRL